MSLGQHLGAALVGGHEHPELPGDDLVEQAVGRQPLAHGVGEADELDAVRMHHAHAAELEAVGEMQDHAAAHQAREGVLGRELRRRRAGRCDPGRRDLPADDALAGSSVCSR